MAPVSLPIFAFLSAFSSPHWPTGGRETPSPGAPSFVAAASLPCKAGGNKNRGRLGESQKQSCCEYVVLMQFTLKRCQIGSNGFRIGRPVCIVCLNLERLHTSSFERFIVECVLIVVFGQIFMPPVSPVYFRRLDLFTHSNMACRAHTTPDPWICCPAETGPEDCHGSRLLCLWRYSWCGVGQEVILCNVHINDACTMSTCSAEASCLSAL